MWVSLIRVRPCSSVAIFFILLLLLIGLFAVLDSDDPFPFFDHDRIMGGDDKGDTLLFI